MTPHVQFLIPEKSARMRCLILLLLSLVVAVAAEPFTLLIKTDNPGSTSNKSFVLPLFFGATYNFTVDWGDGTTEVITTSANPTHTYASTGTYSVAITENVVGGFPQIQFGAALDCQKVLAITKWGDVTWHSMQGAFAGCINLVITATDAATAKTGAVTSFFQAFDGCSALTSFPLLDTSAGTQFTYAWRDCSSLTSFPLLDTSAGTHFVNSWDHCIGLTSFPLLDTSSGIDFSYAWFECTGLTSFPLLDLSSATTLYATWYDCRALTAFPLLTLSSVTDFRYAWSHCSALTSFPLIDTSAGIEFGEAWSSCSGLTSFPLIDTSHGLRFVAAWAVCDHLTTFPQLDTSAGTDFTQAWAACTGLTSFPLLDTSSGLSFHAAWHGCTGLTSFPLIDTSHGTDFFGAWYHCLNLTSFPHLDTDAGTSFKFTWTGCTGLSDFPILDLRNMTDGMYCFSGVTLSSDSYSDLLIDLAAYNSNTNVVFDGGFSRYQSRASSARTTTLIGARSWVITDGGIEPPTITAAAYLSVLTNSPFTYQIVATNTPTSYGAVGLPGTLVVNPTTGEITGTTPVVVGSHTITLSATNAGGTDSHDLVLFVNAAGAPVITSGTTTSGTTHGFPPFMYRITATNTPTSFAAIGLPPGLSVSSSTGRITGVPTTTGSTTATIFATNASGTGFAPLVFTINAATSDNESRCGFGGIVAAAMLLGLAFLARMKPDLA